MRRGDGPEPGSARETPPDVAPVVLPDAEEERRPAPSRDSDELEREGVGPEHPDGVEPLQLCLEDRPRAGKGSQQRADRRDAIQEEAGELGRGELFAS